ncbi:MAG TPA: methyltransferase [Bacteroidia bacterium]|jgi:tRNA1Val (adenine37-N6)-methyltransferase|nr:methyltransferase [Bacteroidia bacterium]
MAGGDSFVFKQFIVKQNKCAMKVGTDAVLLGAWADLPPSGRVLDIGAGTGIIAMMLAQRCIAHIDAIEIDEDAFKQALENCGNCKWKDRLNVHHSSFQDFVGTGSKKYDAIVTNPPYFSNSLHAASESRTKARHTHTLTFEELIDGIKALLHLRGTFATILPCKESEKFVEIAEEKGLYPIRMMRIQTTAAKSAKRVLMQFAFQRNSFSESTLVIENSDRSYTPDYKHLTRDFYLGF